MYKRVFGRIAICFVTVILLLLLIAYGVMWILVNGPSPTAKNLFVLSVKETSAGGFLANIFLSEEEIREIISPSTEFDGTQDEQDLSMIVVPPTTGDSSSNQSTSTDPVDSQSPEDSSASGGFTDTPVDNTDSGIEIVDITGSTYNGKLMIIADPSRVFVGVPDSYGENSRGLTVAKMIEKYDCVAGTNAGGFHDPNGQGTGGIPDGIVIYEGELLWGELDSSYSLAGLDGDGVLHVGNMTARRALEIGVKYAASYGPALVINGKSAGGKYGLGGGLNPRTAIGQRADGAILLLVINGRSVESLGATMDDLASIMLAHGAVNATNLDGGSSSLMIVDGEYLTTSAYLFGERVVATAILVKRK